MPSPPPRERSEPDVRCSLSFLSSRHRTSINPSFSVLSAHRLAMWPPFLLLLPHLLLCFCSVVIVLCCVLVPSRERERKRKRVAASFFPCFDILSPLMCVFLGENQNSLLKMMVNARSQTADLHLPRHFCSIRCCGCCRGVVIAAAAFATVTNTSSSFSLEPSKIAIKYCPSFPFCKRQFRCVLVTFG